jgi:hypothetical protein
MFRSGGSSPVPSPRSGEGQGEAEAFSGTLRGHTRASG